MGAGLGESRSLEFILDGHPRDRRMAVLLVICWLPLLLRAAPVALPSDWSVANTGNNITSYLSNNSYFQTVFSSDDPVMNSYFGFYTLNYSQGDWYLVVAIQSQYSVDLPIVIWSANRNSPVAYNATLSLEGGNLVLRNYNDTSVVWSTDVSAAGESITSIEMQANYNLVMRDADNQILWESFSYPTDTLMPGQNLTHKMGLVAGTSPTNISEGGYQMVVETDAVVLYTTMGSPSVPQPYWISGRGNSKSPFDPPLVANSSMSPLDGVASSQDTDGTVVYTTYILSDGTSSNFFSLHDPVKVGFFWQFGGGSGSSTYFLRLDYDGVLRWYYSDLLVRRFQTTNQSWVQLTVTVDISNSDLPDFFTNPCALQPTYCGPYGICTKIDSVYGNCICPSADEVGIAPGVFQFRNGSNVREGCNFPPWDSTSCVNGEQVPEDLRFLQVYNTSYFSNKYLLPSAVNVSPEECQHMCLTDCSCAAAFFRSQNNYSPAQCFLVRVQELLGMYTVPSDFSTEPLGPGTYNYSCYQRQCDAFIKYNLKNATEQSNYRMSAWKLGVSITSGVFLATACVCVIIVVALRRRSREEDEEEEAFLESLPGLPPRFSFKDLDIATKHFSKVLGEGGFGKVYEGILPDGSKVAVKRLGGSRQGQQEFRAEVATIGGINHLRLVRLWGFCSQGPHRMLVYECMSNGSLDRWLFRDAVLDWPTRYQIAVDTGKGLAYLHDDCRHTIIHLDVKPQNILLDDKFRAKVADFGMSKLFEVEMTEVVTRMRGTPGYLAPEWLLQTGITAKCDVYSYGMVLLEIVGGRKNIDMNAGSEKWHFPAWAVRRMQEDAWAEILDVRLESSLTLEDMAEVKRVVMVAMWCIQDSPRSRPSMGMVVQMLEGVVQVEDPPLQYDFLAIGSREGPPNMINSSTSSLITPPSSVLQSSGPFSIQKVDGIMGSYCKSDSNPSLAPR